MTHIAVMHDTGEEPDPNCEGGPCQYMVNIELEDGSVVLAAEYMRQQNISDARFVCGNDI